MPPSNRRTESDAAHVAAREAAHATAVHAAERAAIDARLAEIDQEAAELVAQLRLLTSRYRALEQERRNLLREPSPSVGLVAMGRTQAIEFLLTHCGGTMRPREIVAALRAAGRSGDDERSVGATLNHLKTRGIAVSPERGRWQLSQSALAAADPPAVKADDLADLAR